jgi:hypothetical protein
MTWLFIVPDKVVVWGMTARVAMSYMIMPIGLLSLLAHDRDWTDVFARLAANGPVHL